jgi:hypothetical protein
MRVIATFVGQHKVPGKSCARLQLNDVPTGRPGENLLDTFPGMDHPGFSACRSIVQRALYVLPGQLRRAIKIVALGHRGRLRRTCTEASRHNSQNTDGQ